MTTESLTAAGATPRCINHPGVETHLRCNKCERPICMRCAVRTPVGYRCRECVQGQQRIFITANWYDYPVAIAVAAVLSGLAGLLLSSLGWWLFVLFLSPIAGTLIASAVQLAVGRRRGRYLVEAAAAGMLVAGLPLMFVGLYLGNWFGVLFQGLYLVLAVGAFLARLRGIRIQ